MPSTAGSSSALKTPPSSYNLLLCLFSIYKFASPRYHWTALFDTVRTFDLFIIICQVGEILSRCGLPLVVYTSPRFSFMLLVGESGSYLFTIFMKRNIQFNVFVQITDSFNRFWCWNRKLSGWHATGTGQSDSHDMSPIQFYKCSLYQVTWHGIMLEFA